jgi:hypothetical protein
MHAAYIEQAKEEIYAAQITFSYLYCIFTGWNWSSFWIVYAPGVCTTTRSRSERTLVHIDGE